MPRRLTPAAVSFVLLLGLFVALFWIPLRPTAWGGPRDHGPFETDEPRAVGRLARDVRLPIERLATARSPSQPLAATAELLLGWHALLAAARFALLGWLLWRMSGREWVATAGVLAAALPMVFGAPRHTDWDVGLLLFVILLASTTADRVPWSTALFGLPALFVAWANAHESAVIGLAWLATIVLGRAIEWWNGWRAGAADRPAVDRLLAALVLCAAAVCLNPDGWRIYPDALRLGKNPLNYQLPAWQPIDFSTGAGMPWGYLVTLAALLVTQLVSPRAFGPTPLVVVLAFGFWPVLQQRGLGYWWLIVPWLVVSLWRPEPEGPGEGDGRAGPDVGRICNPSFDVSGRITNPSYVRRLAVGLLAVALLATPALWSLVLGPRKLEKIVSADTPAQLGLELTTDNPGAHLPEFRDVVQAAYPDGRYRGIILADADAGDFLAWALDGDDTRPVMVYSRPETFDPAIWGEALKALEGATDWWEILGRHQVNLVVVHPGRRDKLADRLRHSAEWAIVEDAPERLVAVRKAPKLPAELQH